jgi:hydrogenase-4 component B
MSGAMLKMGVYGILRITSLFAAPPFAWGAVLLVLGAVTAVYGIALAVSQSDLKRLLAYSSIENVGVIAVGVGLALLGRASGRAEWIVLGLGGAVLHVWNHASFKGLLFFSTGAVIHGCGTRDVEKLGGLLKRMPRTGLAFLVGALAVSALPPLNGFASELLIYLGLLTGWSAATDAAPLLGFAIPAVALAGGLAVAGFVKAFGIVFLGEARSAASERAHEAGPSLLVPIAVLTVPCLFVGTLLPVLAPALDAVTSAWNGVPAPPLAAVAPLSWLPISWLILAALVVLLGLFMRARVGRAPAAAPTWDCGYARPTARMQYTGASFSEWLGERLLPASLRRRAETVAPRGLFPAGSRFALDEARDPVSRRVYEPFLTRWAERFAALRLLQQGRLPVYLVYVFITTLTLLAWAVLRPRILG